MTPRTQNYCGRNRCCSVALFVSLIGIILSCTRFTLSDANVINDVNNMLRDVATATEVDVKDKATTKMLRNVEKNNNNNAGVASDGSDEDDESSSVELLRFVDDKDSIFDGVGVGMGVGEDGTAAVVKETTTANVPAAVAEAIDVNVVDTLSLNDQVRLLTKQLNALTTRRREDYELLEHNLRKSLRITTDAATVDLDIRNELEQLRHEVKSLRDGHLSGNKERLTVDWLQSSIAEIRKQLVELQQIASNTAQDVNHRTQSYEDLATIREDFQSLKLDVAALKEREQQSEVYVQELREEMLQQEEDFKRSLHGTHHEQQQQQQQSEVTVMVNSENSKKADDLKLNSKPLADHNRRHYHFQYRQIHELQLAQRALKQQLNELKYHRIGERVRNIEIEQHRIAEANFNLSRQIASLDKLHTSMLELLEDVEGLQNKMDKNIPELRHEISKLEFSNAQLNSEQNLVREEGKNVARSVQAMAVSVSTLQDERDGAKQLQSTVAQLKENVDRLQSMMQDVQRALVHHQQHRRAGENKLPQHHHNHHYTAHANSSEGDLRQQTYAYAPMTKRAESLVAKLENVEQEYESIINKLPQDCSEVSNGIDGIYMIAPNGQHRPLMVHCSADGWTTVQRRYDGSADFNRSWEDYAGGFGVPAGEYWIGNEQLHHLTRNNCTQLRVLMQDIYDNFWLADYSHFYISSRADGYRLHTSGYSGNASDALDYQQAMQFSAIDVDRDISQTHCAANYEGGWWFSHCQHANLNGRYNLGLTWFDASRNEWIAVKSSQMLIKRQSAATCSGENTVVVVVAADNDSNNSNMLAAASVVSSATTTSSTIMSSKLKSDTPEAATTFTFAAASATAQQHV